MNKTIKHRWVSIRKLLSKVGPEITITSIMYPVKFFKDDVPKKSKKPSNKRSK